MSKAYDSGFGVLYIRDIARLCMKIEDDLEWGYRSGPITRKINKIKRNINEMEKSAENHGG